MGNVGEGLVDNARTSLGEEREAIERGQEMDLLIGPESVGEAGGAELVLSDLIGGFQSIRPIKEEKRGKVGAMVHCHTKFLSFPFFILILRTSHCCLFCLPFHSILGWLWRRSVSIKFPLRHTLAQWPRVCMLSIAAANVIKTRH